MKRWSALLALAVSLVIASPSAAYEIVGIEGTTSYLFLEGGVMRGSTATTYRLDVGAFEEIYGADPGYHVCLSVITRRGDRVGFDSGCYLEPAQTRITGDASLNMVLAPTRITLAPSGRSYTVSAVAQAAQTPFHTAGCNEFGRGWDIHAGPTVGTITVRNTTVSAAGDATRPTYFAC